MEMPLSFPIIGQESSGVWGVCKVCQQHIIPVPALVSMMTILWTKEALTVSIQFQLVKLFSQMSLRNCYLLTLGCQPHMCGHLLCPHGYDIKYEDVNNLLYMMMAPELLWKAEVKAWQSREGWTFFFPAQMAEVFSSLRFVSANASLTSPLTSFR